MADEAPAEGGEAVPVEAPAPTDAAPEAEAAGEAPPAAENAEAPVAPPPPPAPQNVGPSTRVTLALMKPDITGSPFLSQMAVKVPPPEGEEEAEAKFDVVNETRGPDIVPIAKARILKAGFKIVKEVRRHLTKAEAEEFYAEHKGRPFFDKLTGFMSSGPTLALVLEKDDAVPEWRKLIGPTNSIKAREEAEEHNPLNEDLWTLRALFGTDGTRNAFHGSDSVHAAEREIGFFFPEKEIFERSLVVVFPSVAAKQGATDEIVASLEASDFYLLARSFVAVSNEVTVALLGAGDSSEDARIAMQDGPAEVLLVERLGAIPRLKRVVGPPPAVAKASAPNTLRAQWGTDDANLGLVACPDSELLRDVLMPALFPKPLKVEKTLCVIKPGTASTHAREIIREIREQGFEVLAETSRQLAVEEAQEFYAEHKGKPFFEGLCSYMASGPVVALALAKPNAIRAWRQFMGPTNTFVAKRERPSSLRARYGVDGTRNATHGSDSPASAARELRFYFGDLLLEEKIAHGQSAVDYLKKTVVTMAFDPTRSAVVPKTVESVVVDALAALAQAKPGNDAADAVRFLGQWMLENNPRHGIVRQSTSASAASAHRRFAAAASSSSSSGSGPIIVEPDDNVPTRQAATTAAAAAGAALSAARAKRAAAAAASGIKPTIVFVLGGPGAGKGTQCEKIAKKFGYVHLSTGDLLRAEVASGSAFGEKLKATMASGGLVDDATVLKLLKNAMDAAFKPAHDSGKQPQTKFLIDGYPRSVAQALEFERTVGTPTFVLAFDASEAVLEARLVERGKTSGRADDNVEAIRKRFKTYVEQSAPVIDFYAKLGLVKLLNSERTIDEVTVDVYPLFSPSFVWFMGGPCAGRKEQADLLASRNLGYTHLRVSSLTASEIASGSALGKELASIKARGDRITAAHAVALLQKAIDVGGNACGTYLLSDAPRDQEQAAALEAAFGRPAAVVDLQVPDDVRMQRATTAKPGLSARQGIDARAKAKKKLAFYRSELSSLVANYVRQGRVHVIDGNRNVKAVGADIAAALQPDIVFVLGGPGVGKGTQCERIAKEYGYVHLSAGDLLRAEIARRSPHGELINSCIKEGKLVPEAVTLELLHKAIQQATSNKGKRFLVDGFPRDIPQAQSFERTVGSPSQVLFFDAPEDVMVARLLERAKKSGRADDTKEVIEKRLVTFQQQSLPVIRWYAERGAVRTISAVPPPDAVFASLKPFFAAHVVLLTGPPGAGKGTQGAKVAKDFGFVHLSAGDLLRSELWSRKGEIGAEIDELRATIKEGRLVSDELVIRLVSEAVHAAAPRKRFLLDGFPATVEQAKAVEKIFGGVGPSAVLHLDLPAKDAKSRLQKRGKVAAAANKLALALASGVKTPKEALDKMKAAAATNDPVVALLGHRDDDNDAAIDKRLALYAESSPAVLDHYRGQKVLKVFPPSTTAGNAELVYSALKPLFQPQLVVLAGTVGSGRRELAIRAGLELGYATLQVTKLLQEEMEAGSTLSSVIAGAMAEKKTVPIDATLTLIHRAVLKSAASRFIVDGFPRQVSIGFPSVHDQVFALESAIGPVKGCVGLTASDEVRIQRMNAKTPGEIAAVRDKVVTFQREKAPVLAFFSAVGKAATIDTGSKTPEDVYEAARPFLE